MSSNFYYFFVPSRKDKSWPHIYNKILTGIQYNSLSNKHVLLILIFAIFSVLSNTNKKEKVLLTVGSNDSSRAVRQTWSFVCQSDEQTIDWNSQLSAACKQCPELTDHTADRHVSKLFKCVYIEISKCSVVFNKFSNGHLRANNWIRKSKQLCIFYALANVF